MIKRKTRIIALLLCLIMTAALAVFPNVSAAAEDAPVKTDNLVVVSLGDSFSSGEGIEPFYKQNYAVDLRVLEEDWLAHRSEKAWSGQLTFNGISGTLSEHRDTNWFFVATSGAETKHMNGGFEKEYRKISGYNIAGDPTYVSGDKDVTAQLKVFENIPEGEVDYVTMTLGGNDADFVEVVKQAVVGSYIHLGFLQDKLDGVWKSFYADGGIRDKLYQSYKDIAAAAGPQAKIIVAGYPHLLEKSGKGLFSKEAAALVNDSITRFNDEIETLINVCKTEGMRICFVDVEKEFDGHEAYSDDPYLNGVLIGSQPQELKDFYIYEPFEVVASSYSMHPNEKGAQAYARCVQKKIDSIEKDGGKTEWPDMTSSEELDIVLVLDSSGSMDGRPMSETVRAGENFVSTILKGEASIGIVTYDSDAFAVSSFCRSERYLKKALSSVNAGGNTYMEGGLAKAYSMLSNSTAKQKIIVLMSDGVPNRGLVGDELVAYSDEIKNSGIYIYTLGFFSELYSSEKQNAQSLLERIASNGCHYEVDDPDDIYYFFGDIADQISGTKYVYIRVDGPCDVTVSHDGQSLTSKDSEKSQRTDFGTMTFEETEKESQNSTDDRVKVIRLKQDKKYELTMEGNGDGELDYTIGFVDGEGVYSDMRDFTDITVTPDSLIRTIVKVANKTTLEIDDDGDGIIDRIYKASKNGVGKPAAKTATVLLYILLGAAAVALAILIPVRIAKRKKRIAAAPESAPAPAPAPESAPAPAPAAEAAPAQEEYNFCSNCGTRKKKSDTFCPNCGSRSAR